MPSPGTSHDQPVRRGVLRTYAVNGSEPTCDLCAEPARADDFNDAAGLTICTRCIEDLLAEGAMQ